ncbi:hypothetical protein GCM10010218_41350 [Streptomyces mashuensis]|uniref:Uncharacterized protein n=1 Tax=Streptomyces mashuensis TaxID=33904 RepID=A0A919B4K4_9ACTN|nr:hypothetical protein [Streptomyces mashuensis]GHF55546.1 hypothetical protein GCM10010218_41350 [Streptomyces mashuensis]
MDLTVTAYAVYLLGSAALTVWVARTLSRNGRVFLVDVLNGNEKLADAVNHLLVVGFYLVNLGFIALYLQDDGSVTNARGVVENLSQKLGVVLLVLGALHLGNVFVLSRFRRRGAVAHRPQPAVVPPGYGPQAPWGQPTPGM